MPLEHVNVTVADPKATAELLCRLFGWHIRWQGPVANGGYTVHAGDATSYLALFAPDGGPGPGPRRYASAGGLNHIGVEVADLAAAEARVRAAGYEIYSFGDYEPGRRFYFEGPDGIEYEVVSYA